MWPQQDTVNAGSFTLFVKVDSPSHRLLIQTHHHRDWWDGCWAS